MREPGTRGVRAQDSEGRPGRCTCKYQARVAQSRHPGHLLTRETFTEHLLRAGHCPRYQEYVGQLAERAAGTAPRRAEGRGCPVCGRSETGLGGNGAGQSQECASRAATSNAHSRFGASPFLPPRPQPSVPPAGEFPDPLIPHRLAPPCRTAALTRGHAHSASKEDHM